MTDQRDEIRSAVRSAYGSRAAQVASRADAKQPTEHGASHYEGATGDYITVTEIAELAVEVIGLDPSTVRFDYTGGDRGWKGDVPIVRLATDRIRSRGWKNERPTREALRASMESMLPDARAGRL